MLTRYGLPLLAVGMFVFAAIQMTNAQQQKPPAVPPVQPAKSPFLNQLAGSGIVEPETENLSIGTHLPGIVNEVFVKVGDMVRPGMPLFRLDERQLRAELDVRVANLGSAQAMLDKLNSSPRREEVPPLKAKVMEADANLQDQIKAYDRVKRIGTNAISEDEVTRRQMAVEVAKAQVLKAESELALLEAGAWNFDKLVATAAVTQMTASVNQTKTELDRLTVRAPRMPTREGEAPRDTSAGPDMTEFKVLQVNIRPGEFVGTVQGQPLIVLGRVGNLHVRIDIDENDIGRFRTTLKGNAQPRGNSAVVIPIRFVRVEPYVIPKRSLTGSNTERVDTRVLQVIYRLETTDQILYVGQQMEVFLNTDES